MDDLSRELRRSREEILMLQKEDSNNRNIETIGRVGKEKVEQLYQEARE